MPKKSTSARGANRGRAKNQKAFSLVTNNVEEQELEELVADEGKEEEEEASTVESTPSASPKASKESKTRVSTKQAASSTASKESSTTVPVTPRGQRQRQRAAAQLITAEHFSYVRKDLITITVLASLMFGIIVVLYFTLGSVI